MIKTHFAAKLREKRNKQEAEQTRIKTAENDAKLAIKEVGTKYQYDQCNDSVWADLKAQAEEITKKLKEREKFLQTLPTDGSVINPETGEPIYRAAKTSTTSVTVTLK